jgi:hypothetical protein
MEISFDSTDVNKIFNTFLNTLFKNFKFSSHKKLFLDYQRYKNILQTKKDILHNKQKQQIFLPKKYYKNYCKILTSFIQEAKR